MLNEEQVGYIARFIDAIAAGVPVHAEDATPESFFLVAEEPDGEKVFLEVRKDNRFGKNLDS